MSSNKFFSARSCRLALAGLTLSFACLAAPAAHASNKLAVDVGADFPSGTGNDNGIGAGARIGHEWRLTLLTLTPEFGFSYHDFSGRRDATAWDVVAGGRFGIDFGIEPSVFAHAGLGHYSTTLDSNTSLAYDVGAALDLTILPVISFGPHVMLTGIAGNSDRDAFSWLEIGGHVSFSLPD